MILFFFILLNCIIIIYSFCVIKSILYQNLHILQKQDSDMGGNNQSILYAVPISEKKQGESPIYRFPQFKKQLVDSPFQDGKTIKKLILRTYAKYPKHNALGTIVKEGQVSKIQYRTYQQFIQQAHAIGSSIINEQLFNRDQQKKLNFIGIFSRNRAEWSVVDVACVLFKITTIPIYDTLGDQNITYVLKHVGLKTCFVNDGAIKALKKTQDLDQLKTLVSFDPIDADSLKYFQQKGVKLLSYHDLIADGKTKPQDYNHPKYNVQQEDCITFSYTSGTTGPPKGAMISHKNFASFCGAVALNKDTGFCETDVALSYLPLPHILERQYLYSLFYAGASCVYYSGDVAKIKDDLALIKPTLFVSVPRLFSRFYDVLQAKFKQVQGYTKTVLDYAVKTKLSNVTTSGQYTHKIYDPIFFAKTKQALGGRCRLMISGSAPLLPDVHNFMKISMCCPLIQGYGQTQSTGAAFITAGNDPITRHVGGPLSSVQFKLVDIPEMQYLSTDKDEQGRSTPRGQIWIRGHAVFLGYYKDEQKTKQTLTQDGWLKTGDVGQLLHDTKGLKIIDRKKNIFKLQQGEYVAAEKVQGLYSKSDVIDEIFLHGQSTQAFCVAIAVPNKKRVMSIAQQKKIQGPFQEICLKKEIRSEVLKLINNTGKQGGLKGFQQARNIHLEPAGFMVRGILTNTMKIQRHEAKKFYRNAIDKMYQEKQLK